MKYDYYKIRELAQKLLTPQKTLDRQLFDINGKLYPEIRKDLLNITDYAIKTSVDIFDVMEVKDIYMNGSCASYFYRPNSDIDIRIDARNEKAPYLAQDDKYLTLLTTGVLKGATHGFNFKVNKRFVDIKISPYMSEIVGLYSVMNDKWVVKPDKNITEGLNIADICNEYEKQFYIAQDVINNFNSKKVSELSDILNLETYIENRIFKSAENMREYVVYKLLNYSGVFKHITSLYASSLQNIFSIYPPKKTGFFERLFKK